MEFEEWWVNHLRVIEVLRTGSNVEFLKPAFENAFITGELSGREDRKE